MILSKNIPLHADTFRERCADDLRLGRCASDEQGYLEFLIAETSRRPSYRRVMDYIRVLDRQSGKPRFYADADHIVPRSVWSTLLPELPQRGRSGASVNVLSNLFWRDRQWNRSMDHGFIDALRAEARTVGQGTPAGRAWRSRWIEIFLRTKRDEGVLFAGDLIDPRALDRLHAPAEGSSWLSRG